MVLVSKTLMAPGLRCMIAAVSLTLNPSRTRSTITSRNDSGSACGGSDTPINGPVQWTGGQMPSKCDKITPKVVTTRPPTPDDHPYASEYENPSRKSEKPSKLINLG